MQKQNKNSSTAGPWTNAFSSNRLLWEKL